MPKSARPLCFVDGQGGAFAAMAAAIARGAGRDASAATTRTPVVPAEVGVVLAEIALSAPEVAAAIPAGTERIDVDGWSSNLFDGEGDLERLSSARIARDRIERRVEALLTQKAKR